MVKFSGCSREDCQPYKAFQRSKMPDRLAVSLGATQIVTVALTVPAEAQRAKAGLGLTPNTPHSAVRTFLPTEAQRAKAEPLPEPHSLRCKYIN